MARDAPQQGRGPFGGGNAVGTHTREEAAQAGGLERRAGGVAGFGRPIRVSDYGVAGLEWDFFKQKLSERGIEVIVDESPDEVQAGASLIRRLRDVS